MKVLVVGPSDSRSRGGMATVIKEMRNSDILNQYHEMDFFESFIDGNFIVRLGFSILAYFRFLKCYRKYDLFHIHVASYGSTFRKNFYLKALKRSEKKVILHIHGAEYLIFFDKLSNRKKKSVVEFLKNADRVIALSQDWKEKFDRTFQLKNCVVLENGIDVDYLKPAINDSKVYQKSFLMLGRLGERKGTYDLVNAIEQVKKNIPDIKCYLAGDGEVEKFRQIVARRGLEDNIEVVGWIDSEQKVELLSQVSTVVLPSYNEGLPMAILEGMACGKVIISTTVGGIPEVVKSDNGILVEPGDIKALVEALVSICKENKIQQISQANITKINKKFSRHKMHNTLVEYYQEINRLS